MNLDSYATLARLGPVVRTGEAAAALNISLSQASRSLRRLESAGLARNVRRGLWIVGTDALDPRRLAEDITRPYPAYVSFLSALSAHGMIDQVPRQISLASLDSAKRVATSLGTFSVHHLPPELFEGWTERDGIKLADPDKALFDLAYVSAVHHGRLRHLPELELPRGFKRFRLQHWLGLIPSPRVRTLTSRGVQQALSRAVR